MLPSHCNKPKLFPHHPCSCPTHITSSCVQWLPLVLFSHICTSLPRILNRQFQLHTYFYSCFIQSICSCLDKTGMEDHFWHFKPYHNHAIKMREALIQQMMQHQFSTLWLVRFHPYFLGHIPLRQHNLSTGGMKNRSWKICQGVNGYQSSTSPAHSVNLGHQLHLVSTPQAPLVSEALHALQI